MMLSRLQLTLFSVLLFGAFGHAQNIPTDKKDRELMKQFSRLQRHMVEEQKELRRLGAQLQVDAPKGADPDLVNFAWVGHVETEKEQIQKQAAQQLKEQRKKEELDEAQKKETVP